VKGVLKGIASGLNVSYVSLASDLEGVTYSSIRQGSLDERDHWRVLQGWLIEHFHLPVFESWLLSALSAPAADSGINLPVDKFDKFNQPLFIPRGWQWVDPQKETDATLTAIDGGLTTLTKALAEKGDDLEEVLRERQAEQELAASLGVELGKPKPKAPPGPPAAPKDDQAEAEETEPAEEE
jgi:lambda family phage portal protein